MPRHVRRTANLRRRLYEILEHGSIGDRTGLMVGRLIVLLIVINLVSMTLDSVPELQTQYGALFTIIELLSLVVFTIEYALRVWVAAEHAPAGLERAQGAMEVRLEPARCDRPPRRLAVLACICVARRSAGPARVSDGPLSQVGALLARHAFAVGRSLQRASRAIRLFCDLARRNAGRCKHHARHRAPRAAREIRHHSRRDVVGDRYAGHDRLWRRGSGDRARPSRRIYYDLRWIDHGGTADRHCRHGLRR